MRWIQTITNGGRRQTASALRAEEEMEPTPRTNGKPEADNPAWQLEASGWGWDAGLGWQSGQVWEVFLMAGRVDLGSDQRSLG